MTNRDDLTALVNKVLDGIDRTETEHVSGGRWVTTSDGGYWDETGEVGGWWSTSGGADFGATKRDQLIDALLAAGWTRAE